MEKSRRFSKIKEPVRLRAKTLANGNLSLYLDSYSNGKRSSAASADFAIPMLWH